MKLPLFGFKCKCKQCFIVVPQVKGMRPPTFEKYTEIRLAHGMRRCVCDCPAKDHKLETEIHANPK